MDSPNVSIKELFADFRESMYKHQKNQNHRFPLNGSQLAPSVDDKETIFGSLLKPMQVTSHDHLESKIRLQTTAKTNDDASNAVKVQLSQSQMSPNLHRSTDSLSSKQLPTSRVDSANNGTTSSFNQNGGNGNGSMPEYIPPCEAQRRQAVGDALRASMKKITAGKPKTLSWNRPSFHCDSTSDGAKADSTRLHRDKGSSSSFTARPGKRKACSTDFDASITNYCGLHTNMTQPRGEPLPSTRGGRITSSSNSACIDYEHEPYSSRHGSWTKEEVDGLVTFARKWITPGLKRVKK